MPRIPLLTADTATGDAVRALNAPTGHMNIFRALAHADGCVLPLMKLGRAILTSQKLPDLPRELLILLAVGIEGGEYEWIQHADIALSVGGTQAQIDAIRARDLDNPVFSDSQRALLKFGAQVVESVRVDAAVFAELRRHVSDQEIVEAILAMGFYMTLARVTEALEVEPDAVQGTAVLAAAKKPR